MTRLRNVMHLLMMACLVGSLMVGCAPKDEKKGLEVDQDFLSEALGEDSQRKQVSREEILARRRAREEARRRAEAQASARKAAEDARRRQAEEAAGSMAAKSRDPQYQLLQTTCKRCAFYLDAGDLDRALEQATSMVNVREKSPEAHVLLGVVQRKRGEHDKALESFEAAYKLEPDNEWAVANLGRAYRRAGDFKKAEAIYQDHLSRYPTSQAVLYNMGIFQELYRGDKQQALVYFVRYLRAGGERKDEVNPWVTVLAQDLGVERPRTPGFVSAEELAAQDSGGGDDLEPVLGGEAEATAEAPAGEGASAEAAQAAETPAPEAGAAEGTATEGAVAEGPAEAGAAATPATAAASAPPAAAVAAAPVVEETRVPVTLYPFEVAKGAVEPALLQQVDQIFRDILGLGVDLTAPAEIDTIEKQKGWSGKCGSAQCQVRVAFTAKANYLVHGEIAQSPKAWYVIVDIYNLQTRSKSRLKLQAAIADGDEAFYAKLRSMAKATGRKLTQ
ncbi:MAG: tetratricopeptide repeat protein [Chrysiogenetes bacterium]|nr:tetratricopeptide repeat protein [Chrysiogenetes bacterium]